MERQIKLVEGDITNLPFRDNFFDAVIDLGVPISHITNSLMVSSAVAEMSRVVRPGGKVFLTGMARTACYRGAIF